ncbi:MAG TPA: hypothetical protein VFU68_02980, partial [Terracidiphilus sp.]|nr:hypothetical protein [Terracidiphilus sp.]
MTLSLTCRIFSVTLALPVLCANLACAQGKASESTSTTATVSVTRPGLGFNVIPGSVRRLYATVSGGVTNGVQWSVKGGGV